MMSFDVFTLETDEELLLDPELLMMTRFLRGNGLGEDPRDDGCFLLNYLEL